MPEYDAPVIWVKDASRAVGVAQNLISETGRDAFVRKTREEYEQVREHHLGRQKQIDWLPLSEARANATRIDPEVIPPAPKQPGIRVMQEIPIAELRDYIDWSPLFTAWDLNGAYPRILDDPDKGEQARKLFADANHWLDRIISEGWFTARAVYGLFPAASIDGDSIVVFSDEEHVQELARFHFLRQQQDKKDTRANLCLADFVARENDHIGGFACAIFGADEQAKTFEMEHDDYAAIMVKVLADRLAEACAEMLHRQVRLRDWGYAADEELSNEELIREKYQGIRPALGYPACPDHTEKGTLWQLLDVEATIGMGLTESYAMTPGAAVSGLYFAHPEAKYFTVGKINRDQVEDYAGRKGMSVEQAEKWLGPVLGY